MSIQVLSSRIIISPKGPRNLFARPRLIFTKEKNKTI